MLRRTFTVALITTASAAAAPSSFSWTVLSSNQAIGPTTASKSTTDLASHVLRTNNRLQAHRLKTPSRRKLCSPKQRCNDAIPIVISLNGENPYEVENNNDGNDDIPTSVGIPETVRPNTNVIPSNRPTVIFDSLSTDIPTDAGTSLGIVTDGTGNEGGDEEEYVNNANNDVPTPFPSVYLPMPQEEEVEVDPSAPTYTGESGENNPSYPVAGPTPVEAHLQYPVNALYGKASKIPIYGVSSGSGYGSTSSSSVNGSSSSKSGKLPSSSISSGMTVGGDYSNVSPGVMSMGYQPVAASPTNGITSSSKAGKLPSPASAKDEETSGDEGMNTIVMGNSTPSTSAVSYGGKADKGYGTNPTIISSVPGGGALFGKSGKYPSGSSEGKYDNDDKGSGGSSTAASPLPTAKPTSPPTSQSTASTESPTYEIQPVPETDGLLVDTFPEDGDDIATVLTEDGYSTPSTASPSHFGSKSSKYPISGGSTIYIHGPAPSPSNTVAHVSYSSGGGKSGKPHSSNIAGSPSPSTPTAESSSSWPASSSLSGGKSGKYPIAGGSIIHIHGPGTSSPTSGDTAYSLDNPLYISGSKASKASRPSSIGLIWDDNSNAIDANVVGSSKSGKYSTLPDGYVQPNKPYPIGSEGSSSVPYFVYDDGKGGGSSSSTPSSKGMGVSKSAGSGTGDFAWNLSSKSSKASLVSGTSICLEPDLEVVHIKGSSKSVKTSTIITIAESSGSGARRRRRRLGSRNRHLSTKSAKSSSLSIFHVTDCQNEPVPSPVTDTLSPTQSNYPTASDFKGFPEANDDFAETTENQFVVIKYHENDTIPEGSTVTYTEPSSGRLILTRDEFIYTPIAAFCGFDTFTYTINDSTGKFSDMATVTIHVKCAGDTLAPTAAATPQLTEAKIEIPQLLDDQAETTMNTPVSIPVLENDIYVPPNSAGSIDQPMNGTCSVEESGILYSPDSGFCGIDSFNYTITDASGTFSDTATCFVSVLCSPSSPTTAPDSPGPTLSNGPSEVPEANDDYVETNRDTPVIVDVLDNDVVPEGTTGSFTRPSNGTVKMENDDLLYQPDQGFCGFDIFSYTLQDEKRSVSDSAQVTVKVICSDGDSSLPTVSPTPMASGSEALGDPKLSDDYFEGNPGDRVQLPVLNNDSVPADSTVDVTQPSNGSVLMDNETLVYIPDEEFCGFDSFSYTVSSPDKSFEETAKVTVLIKCQVTTQVPIDSLSPTVSPTPMASGSDIVGDPKLVNDYFEGNSGDRVPVPILDNDKYPANSTIDISEPSNGSLSMENDTLIYTPNEGFCGEDSFDYTVTVPAADGSESKSSTTTATVAILCDEDDGDGVVDESLFPTVSPTPMASGSEIVGDPKLVNDYYEGNSGDRISVPILDNDKYPTNSTIELGEPSNGSLSMENDTLIYTPNEGFCGEDSFDYTVTVPSADGSAAATATATATVTILCDEDNGSDVMSDSFPPTVSPTPMASGSEIVGDPKLVNDYYEGNSGNRIPVPILDNDKYPSNSTINLDEPSNGSLSMENNTLIYTPNEGFCGEDSFDYTVTVPSADGSAAATATATATVTILCDEGDGDGGVDESLIPTVSPTPMASGSEIVGDPKLVNDYYEGNSGNRVPVPILDNDKYPSNSTIDLDAPSNGSLSMENNTLIYTPNEGFCGEDSFNYTVTVPAADGSAAATATATATVTILCDEGDGGGGGGSGSGGGGGGSGGGVVDDSLFPTVSPTPMASGSDIVGNPKLVNDYFEGNSGDRVPVPILDNDKYPANSTIDFDEPSNGSLSMENDTLIYTPNEGFCGEDSFNYTVTNEFGQSATASSTITILCNSDADPSETIYLVNDDFAQGNMGETIAIPVLANDTIPSNSTGLFTQPENGVIVMNQDGLLYTPNSNFCGIDYFNYTVTGLDFDFTATASVTVEVSCDGVSSLPTPSPSFTASGSEAVGEPLAKNDFYQGNQGDRIEVPVLENDFFPDGSTGSYTQPANGTIEFTKNGTVIVYVPEGGFCGFDTFNYTITEPSGMFSSTGVVTIFVACEGQSLMPTASPTPLSSTTELSVLIVNDDSALTGQNESVVIPVLENDLYPVGSSASFNQPANGSISVSKDGIVYEPFEDFCGLDTFNYTITDSIKQLTGTAIVTVLVDCNVEANDDLAIVVGDSFVIIPVLENDSYGTMPTADLSILSLSVPSQGIAEIVVGNVKYTPNPEVCNNTTSENVMDSFLYTIQNQVGATDFASVSVEICCTCEYSNNAPFVLNDSVSTTFNTPVSVNVLENDEDSDGDDLTVTQIIMDAMNGTCTVSDNGQQVTYAPDKDFHGSDMCVYEACDDKKECGDAEITITVARNQAPIATDDSVNTTQGKSVLVSVLDNDYDDDGDELKVTSVSSAQQGSCRVSGDSMSILYISDAFYVGEDSCIYTVCDTEGACDTAAVMIEIIPPNGGPIATNDEVSVPQDSGLVVLNVLDNDEDSDGDQLTVDTILYDANNGVCAVHDNGSSVSYTPNSGYSGQDICVYSVCDAKKSCDSAAVTITIQAAPDEDPTEAPQTNSNTPPIAMDDFATTQEFEPIFINVAANDINADGGALSLSTKILSCDEGGSIEVIGDGSGGVVEYTPPIEFVGVDNCMYTVCNKSGACDSANLVVTVESAALPPIAENDERETEQNTPIEIYVTENDLSPDNLPLTINGVQATSQQGGSVSIAGFETASYVIYKPPVDFIGNDQFLYSITDGSKNASAIVYVAVTGPNTIPLAKNDACTTSMNNSVLVYVLDNDDGPGNNSVTLVSASNGLNGTCVVLEAEIIKYTPNPGYAGVDSCIYSVSDESGLSSDAVLTITVLPVALPVNISTESNQGTGVIVFSSLFNYPTFDVSGIRLITDPVHGTVAPDENEVGTFVYTPEQGFEGTDSCEYEICTMIEPVLCAQSTVTITVLATAQVVTNEAFSAQASPIAINDNTTTVMGISVVTDVLANDFDPEDDELTIVEDNLIDGINGTCLISGRNIEYIPSAGFVGVDTCTYSISDGRGGTDSAILAVTVFPFVKPMNETTDVDTPVAISVADSLESPDIDASTGVKVYTAPTNGEVEVMNDGTLIYTPYAGFEGVDEFEYEVCAFNTPNLCSYSSASILVSAEFSGGSNDVPGFAFTDDEGEGNVDDFIATSSYVCNEVSESEVISTRILFKYDLINNNEQNLETTIDLIELKLQNLLRKEVVCNGRRRLRRLSITNMVGVNTNPPDKESDRTCISNKGKCVVIDGGITVFGDVDIEEVKGMIKSNLPAIVSEASGFNTSALNSEDSTDTEASTQFEYVAIAGAVAVVAIGAALLIRKRTQKKNTENNLEEAKPWIKTKSSLRDIDTIGSSGVKTTEWPKSSIMNSSNTTPGKESKASFFKGKPASPELIPISPANSIFSIPSSKSNREYNVDDTVDL